MRWSSWPLLGRRVGCLARALSLAPGTQSCWEKRDAGEATFVLRLFSEGGRGISLPPLGSWGVGGRSTRQGPGHSSHSSWSWNLSTQTFLLHHQGPTAGETGEPPTWGLDLGAASTRHPRPSAPSLLSTPVSTSFLLRRPLLTAQPLRAHLWEPDRRLLTIISSSTVSPMTLNLLLLKLSDFHILHLKDRPAPASQMVTEAGENGVQCQAHCGVGAGQR